MERIRSLDLARGFTVLFIPAIHTGMLYSHISVHTSVLGYFLIAIAEGPGGQLLMLLMGLSFTFRQRHTTSKIGLRSLLLLLTGYLLNILKFIIPYSYGALPHGVIQDLQLSNDGSAIWQLFGLGDILHFAAMATVILHLVYRCTHFHIVAFITAITVVLISPWVWDTHFEHPLLDYISALATGQPPRVFFPLFPWLVYPLLGLVIGHYFKKDQQRTFTLCGIIAGMLISSGLLLEDYFPAENPLGFYRTPISGTMWHVGIVLLALYGWHLISSKMKQRLFVRLLTYSSENITVIYLIQWVMICWMLPVFGYQQLGLLLSILVMVAMTMNTYLLTLTFQLIKKRYGQQHL